jgi:hypothetical protein
MRQIRPIPGIKFRTETPVTVDLPRMDITGFVGFAARGPTHIPVPVESLPEFEDIFGGLYPLAWDERTETWQTACLAPAVKAFFKQGGKRCWVVRVAHSEDEYNRTASSSQQNKNVAISNTFKVAGLLQKTTDGEYCSVVSKACSAGSWSDHLQVKANLLYDPINLLENIALSLSETASPSETTFSLLISVPGGQPIQAGDLLQVDFSCNDGVSHRVYVAIHPEDLSRKDQGVQINAHPQNTSWFHQLTLESEEPWTGTVCNPQNSNESFEAELVLAEDTHNTGTGKDKRTTIRILNQDNSSRTEDSPILTSTLKQDWLKFIPKTNDGGERLVWLLVGQRMNETGFHIDSVWMEGINCKNRNLQAIGLRRLKLSVKVQIDATQTIVLSDLAFAPPHPRYIGYLPSDDSLFDPGFGKPNRQHHQPWTQLWEAVKHPRFPLYFLVYQESQQSDDWPVFLPLGLDEPGAWRGAEETSKDALVRDGLVPPSSDSNLDALTSLNWAAFFPELFLDRAMQDVNQRSLIATAQDRLYFQGKSLKGIHSLLPVEEISLISAPDAAHPGWVLTKREKAVTAPPLPSEVSLDPCTPEGPFRSCEVQAENSPKEKTDFDHQEAEASVIEEPSLWKLVLPSPENVDKYTDALLKVQDATAKLAAARGDLVAVLGMPKHYQMADVLKHQQQLAGKLQQAGESTRSYVALYHPWITSRTETGELVHIHPAGHACGVMAARSLARGAWVAPANENLKDVLATLPTLSIDDEWAFYQAGINPIRTGANSIAIWGSYTQSPEPELEDLNVRRLLILLRRLALAEGQSLAFAPNSPALRRQVKQRFEQRLGHLFKLGAFAGRDPATAYQVGIDETLNTPTSVEQGRLIVDLRVAPSRPLMFITVRLIQTAHESLTIQEVVSYGR